MQRLFNWLARKVSPAEKPAVKTLRQTAPRVRPKPAKQTPAQAEAVEFTGEVGGKIMDGGPGKNVLVRNKYVREDTGTHETLTIIDDSILDTADEDDSDPYNSGRFDRSKSWDSSRSRK
jgi:hypothetical protein